VHGLSAFAFCCLAFTLTACATPYGPNGYTDFPVGSGEYAIAVGGSGAADRVTLMRDFHRRASELCGGRYSFRSEMSSDESGPSMTGYVRCDAREADPSRAQASAAVSSRVVQKDGQNCLQGLDAEGSVVVEDCQLAKGGR
jgi:hypothetical protein